METGVNVDIELIVDTKVIDERDWIVDTDVMTANKVELSIETGSIDVIVDWDRIVEMDVIVDMVCIVENACVAIVFWNSNVFENVLERLLYPDWIDVRSFIYMFAFWFAKPSVNIKRGST